MPDISLPFTINGIKEEIKFTNFPLISKRKAYEIELLRGIDAEGNISEDFSYPEEGTILWTLLEFVKTGESSILEQHSLKIVENPGKDVISRNITLVDPSNNEMYVVGSVGLVKFSEKNQTLTLEDPKLDTTFHDYQQCHGRNPGGVVYFSEEGLSSENNLKPLGVSYISEGPTSLLKKIDKTNRVRNSGIFTPQYLAAGRINNLGDKQWGFTIYKTPIQPDVLKNLKLYIDSTINLKESYFQYIRNKYKTLHVLHETVKCAHGQPTMENAGGIILIDDKQHAIGSSILKDMDTLTAIPESTNKSLIESPCPQNIGLKVKKSPHIAAKIYDLQLALTQELGILLIASQPLPDINVKLKFLQYQLSILLKEVCTSYGLNQEQVIPQITNFCLQHYINAVKKGHSFNLFTEILGGLAAHAIFGFSEKYKEQIEVFPDN